MVKTNNEAKLKPMQLKACPYHLPADIWIDNPSTHQVIDISQMESKEEQYTWYQLSPRHLEHRVQLPTAITLYKLFPKQHSATSVSQVPSVHMYKVMPLYLSIWFIIGIDQKI